MKKLHLICNAHIDPLWLWNWSDGISAGISTFSTAVRLADKFDYIFCHNESLLYEAVKRHAPSLFERIKDLVKKGKWCIMGGWYLQSDCNMPEGETINRCLNRGLEFFDEEFGVRPETAISFDAFGHNKGLVQILSGNGYKNYIICRPSRSELSLDNELFYWDGHDGSEIKVFRAVDHYNSARGLAVAKITNALNNFNDVSAVLWGVGNHGGGPSEADLKGIEELIKTSEDKIIHSTPDRFFEEVEIPKNSRYKESLRNSMPGCYTSMATVKNRFRKAEGLYYSTEILASYTAEKKDMQYPADRLKEAMEGILKCSFHDIIPGTAIKLGEDFAINNLGKVMSILEEIRLDCILKLIDGERPGIDGEYPIFVFNPQPFTSKVVLPCEFILADQNYGEYCNLPVAMFNGKRLNVQLVRESSNLSVDWSKKMLIECELPPMQLSRITVTFENGEYPVLKSLLDKKTESYTCDGRSAIFNVESGLVEDVEFNGVEFCKKLFRPVLYDDVPDPWMMEEKFAKGFLGEAQPLKLLSEDEVKDFVGAGDKSSPCYRLEDGVVCTRLESLFGINDSKVKINYTIYKNRSDIDVSVGVLWNERNKVLKLEVPIMDGDVYVQGMFGRDKLVDDGSENLMHKWVGVNMGDKVYGVINDGVYGCSKKGNVLSITLLRGTTYAAHPIPGRSTLRTDGHVQSMDLGWHEFNFRIGCFDNADIDREALVFNRLPYAFNLFPVPSNSNKINDFSINLDGKGVNLISVSRNKGKTIFRLYNTVAENNSAVLNVSNVSFKANFKGYEVKTLIYNGATITQSNRWDS
ncbi:MAG: hypothetical protein E7369_05915 [Clostridiales bacterium]|nr:hypothetical protein [Clostridiales bacterium]